MGLNGSLWGEVLKKESEKLTKSKKRVFYQLIQIDKTRHEEILMEEAHLQVSAFLCPLFQICQNIGTRELKNMNCRSYYFVFYSQN